MPFTLALEYSPRLTTHADTRPVWQRVRAVAEEATAAFFTLWHGLLLDFRTRLSLARLREALAAPHLLDAEQVLLDAWHAAVEQVAPDLLTLLIQTTVRQAAEMVDTVAEGLPFSTEVPDIQQALDGYRHGQLASIAATTLLALRQVLRAGAVGADSRALRARLVYELAGLTPRQAHSIEATRARWQADGMGAQEQAVRLRPTALLGIQRRAQGIATTQAYGAANLGQRLALRQAGRDVRGFWMVARDERLCPICQRIPGMNPDGIPLDGQFQTPAGLVDGPPIHVMCRCSVDYR